ncbi:hypothetical protein MINTM019_11690 [Mycobacterium paraintracellulare]|nr:hypothetical protein MINTM011_12000 [Mycobacterium paraintracellulare]BCP03713.1 hypothetical protein MINTM019_11690 [Mycobacterium paraintracellulare]
MIKVCGVMLGLVNGAQPCGVGIEIVRPGTDSGATGWPVTPMLCRYCDRGTGFAVGVVVEVVGVFDKID